MADNDDLFGDNVRATPCGCPIRFCTLTYNAMYPFTYCNLKNFFCASRLRQPLLRFFADALFCLTLVSCIQPTSGRVAMHRSAEIRFSREDVYETMCGRLVPLH
jgi:hypothetical protein